MNIANKLTQKLRHLRLIFVIKQEMRFVIGFLFVLVCAIECMPTDLTVVRLKNNNTETYI